MGAEAMSEDEAIRAQLESWFYDEAEVTLFLRSGRMLSGGLVDPTPRDGLVHVEGEAGGYGELVRLSSIESIKLKD